MKFYRLGDTLPYNHPLRQGRTIEEPMRMVRRESDGLCFMAQNSGIKRKPKKGEWYISGSNPLAYVASNDLNSEYHIANIVVVKRTTIKKLEVVS